MQCYRFCEAPPSSSFNTNQVAMANRNASGADIEVVGPLREPEFGTLHHPVLPMKPVIANNFITLILSEQLSHAAKSRNQMLTVNQDPSLAGLWRQYHICTEECLKFINRNIHGSAKDSAVIVLVAILSLATADEYVDASLWQAHFSGALAFIKHRGGPATVLKMLGTPAPLYFLCWYVHLPYLTTAVQYCLWTDIPSAQCCSTIQQARASVKSPDFTTFQAMN